MNFFKLFFSGLGVALLLTGQALYSEDSPNLISPTEKKIGLIMETNPGQGMFSVFFTVASYLDRYDRGELMGLQIHFGKGGLYYDPSQGLNWWEYYCEPVRLGPSNGVAELSSSQTAHHLAYETEMKLSRKRLAELTQKYIKIKPEIQKEVDAFVLGNFGKFVVGVHYRGTDKGNEAPKVPYEVVSEAVDKLMRRRLKEMVIFVATDEKAFLQYMQQKYPGKVVCQDCFRSATGLPIHTMNESPYRQGKESIIDCLLLSRCQILLRTSSNLSLWSTFFNPQIPVIELSQRHA